MPFPTRWVYGTKRNGESSQSEISVHGRLVQGDGPVGLDREAYFRHFLQDAAILSPTELSESRWDGPGAPGIPNWPLASRFCVSFDCSLPGGRTDSVFGWGLNASGALRLLHNDNVIVEGTYGRGISRYLNDTAGLGIDAAVISVAKPHLRATPAAAAVFGYQHYWSKRVRSNLVYSFAQVQNTAFQRGSIYRKSDYSAANIIWNPVGSLNAGTEFLYGSQELKNGQSGNARLEYNSAPNTNS